eukprot:g1711.t1
MGNASWEHPTGVCALEQWAATDAHPGEMPMEMMRVHPDDDAIVQSRVLQDFNETNQRLMDIFDPMDGNVLVKHLVFVMNIWPVFAMYTMDALLNPLWYQAFGPNLNKNKNKNNTLRLNPLWYSAFGPNLVM